MALSARELFLIVRAQNQASSVLRKVSADMSALGRKEALSSHRAQLGLARNKLLNAQQAITNKLASEETGPAAIARKRAQMALENDAMNLLGQRRQAEQALQAAEAHTSVLQEKRSRVLNSSKATQLAYNEAVIRNQKALDAAHGTIEKTTRSLASNGAQITRNGKAWNEVGRAVQEATTLYPQATTKQAALNAETAKANTRIAEHRANLQANAQALAQNQEKFKQLAQAEKAFKMERIGQATHLLGSMGRQLQLVGFAGAAALGFAANSAANLSTQVTLATTQYKNNVEQVKRASDVNFSAIIKDMQQFPAAASDMASSLYDIFSTLNVNGRQGRDILYQVNKAAVAGQLSVKDATAGVLSVLSNFKEIPQTGKGVETALNRIFAAVRFGRVTMQEFSTSLQTTAPAAKQTGQEFNNLAGTVAFLSRSLGISKASVGYARLLQQLTSTAMVQGLNKHGIAVRNAAGQYKQLDVIVGEIAKKFPQLTTGQESAQNFFKTISGTTGTIQGARAFTTLIRDVSGYKDILNKTTNDNNEFQKSFDALNQTAGVQFGKALNVLKSLWIELGRAAIPVIAKLFAPIGDLATKLSQLDQSTKNSIGRIVAIGLAIVAVTGVVMSLTSALGGALLIFMSIGGGVLLGITAGFLALAAAIYLIITNWDKLAPRIQAALPAIETAVQGAVKGVTAVLRGTAGIIAGFIGLVDALLRGDWGDAWDAAAKVVVNFGKLVGVALRGVETILQGWLTLVTSGVTGFVIGMSGAALAGVKLVAVLKEVEVAYQAVTVAELEMGAAGATGGRGATIGAGLGSLVTNIRNMKAEFQAAKLAGTGTFAALGSSVASLLPALGVGGWLVVGIVAVGAAFLVLRSIFGGHIGQTNTFLQQQDQMVARADQVTNAINGETRALNGLAAAATGVANANLDAKQAQLDLVTSRRAYHQAIQQARSDGKVTKDESLNLQQLKINWDRAKQSAISAGDAAKKAHANLTALRARAAGALADTPGDIAQTQATLLARQRRLQAFLSSPLIRTGAISAQDAKNAKAALDQVNASITKNAASAQKLQVARGQITNYIKAIAPGATADQVQALTDKMVALHRVLTPKEVKILLNSGDLDKATKKAHDTRKAIEDIGKHHAVKLSVDTSSLTSAQKVYQHHAMGAANAATITANPQPAIAAAKKAGDAIDKVGHKHVKPTINTQFKPDSGGIATAASSLGQAAKQGVMNGAAGLGTQLGIQMSADVIAATAQAKHAIGAKSPSKKTRDEVGIPLAQGIIVGFSQEMKKNWGRTAQSVQRLMIKGLDFSGQSAKEKAKTIADAFKQAMDTAIQTLTDKWQTIHDINQQNFGELFQGTELQLKIDWGAKLGVDDLQKDLSGQLAKFRTFNASLARIQRRGGPQSMIDALRALGPAAQGELDALNRATPQQLKRYERTWKASQKAINQATKQQFKQQIKDWKEQGRAVAAGILMGLRSEQGGLEKYFKHVWLQMIATTRKTNKSHSPSQVYAAEGVNIIEGLRMGMDRAARGLAVPSPGVGPAWGRRGAQGGGTVIYQTINAHHSESLDTTLRKANFRLKHRKR